MSSFDRLIKSLNALKLDADQGQGDGDGSLKYRRSVSSTSPASNASQFNHHHHSHYVIRHLNVITDTLTCIPNLRSFHDFPAFLSEGLSCLFIYLDHPDTNISTCSQEAIHRILKILSPTFKSLLILELYKEMKRCTHGTAGNVTRRTRISFQLFCSLSRLINASKRRPYWENIQPILINLLDSDDSMADVVIKCFPLLVPVFLPVATENELWVLVSKAVFLLKRDSGFLKRRLGALILSQVMRKSMIMQSKIMGLLLQLTGSQEELAGIFLTLKMMSSSRSHLSAQDTKSFLDVIVTVIDTGSEGDAIILAAAVELLDVILNHPWNHLVNHLLSLADYHSSDPKTSNSVESLTNLQLLFNFLFNFIFSRDEQNNPIFKPDNEVRISIKTSFVSCIRGILQLCYDSHQLPLSIVSLPKQFLHLLTTSGHQQLDPQIRIQLVRCILIPLSQQPKSSIKEEKEERGSYDGKSQQNRLSPGEGDDVVKLLFQFFHVTSDEADSIFMKEFLATLVPILKRLLFLCPFTIFSKLITLTIGLANHSYWLIRVQVSRVLSNIPFNLVKPDNERESLQLQQKTLQVMYTMLCDDDHRVRSAASTGLVNLIKFICIPGLTESSFTEDHLPELNPLMEHRFYPIPMTPSLAFIPPFDGSWGKGQLFPLHSINYVVSGIHKLHSKHHSNYHPVLPGIIESLNSLSCNYPFPWENEMSFYMSLLHHPAVCSDLKVHGQLISFLTITLSLNTMVGTTSTDEFGSKLLDHNLRIFFLIHSVVSCPGSRDHFVAPSSAAASSLSSSMGGGGGVGPGISRSLSSSSASSGPSFSFLSDTDRHLFSLTTSNPLISIPSDMIDYYTRFRRLISSAYSSYLSSPSEYEIPGKFISFVRSLVVSTGRLLEGHVLSELVTEPFSLSMDCIGPVFLSLIDLCPIEGPILLRQLLKCLFCINYRRVVMEHSPSPTLPPQSPPPPMNEEVRDDSPIGMSDPSMRTRLERFLQKLDKREETHVSLVKGGIVSGQNNLSWWDLWFRIHSNQLIEVERKKIRVKILPKHELWLKKFESCVIRCIKMYTSSSACGFGYNSSLLNYESIGITNSDCDSLGQKSVISLCPSFPVIELHSNIILLFSTLAQVGVNINLLDSDGKLMDYILKQELGIDSAFRSPQGNRDKPMSPGEDKTSNKTSSNLSPSRSTSSPVTIPSETKKGDKKNMFKNLTASLSVGSRAPPSLAGHRHHQTGGDHDSSGDALSLLQVSYKSNNIPMCQLTQADALLSLTSSGSVVDQIIDAKSMEILLFHVEEEVHRLLGLIFSFVSLVLSTRAFSEVGIERQISLVDEFNGNRCLRYFNGDSSPTLDHPVVTGGGKEIIPSSLTELVRTFFVHGLVPLSGTSFATPIKGKLVPGLKVKQTPIVSAFSAEREIVLSLIIQSIKRPYANHSIYSLREETRKYKLLQLMLMIIKSYESIFEQVGHHDSSLAMASPSRVSSTAASTATPTVTTTTPTSSLGVEWRRTGRIIVDSLYPPNDWIFTPGSNSLITQRSRFIWLEIIKCLSGNGVGSPLNPIELIVMRPMVKMIWETQLTDIHPGSIALYLATIMIQFYFSTSESPSSPSSSSFSSINSSRLEWLQRKLKSSLPPDVSPSDSGSESDILTRIQMVIEHFRKHETGQDPFNSLIFHQWNVFVNEWVEEEEEKDEKNQYQEPLFTSSWEEMIFKKSENTDCSMSQAQSKPVHEVEWIKYMEMFERERIRLLRKERGIQEAVESPDFAPSNDDDPPYGDVEDEDDKDRDERDNFFASDSDQRKINVVLKRFIGSLRNIPEGEHEEKENMQKNLLRLMNEQIDILKSDLYSLVKPYPLSYLDENLPSNMD